MQETTPNNAHQTNPACLKTETHKLHIWENRTNPVQQNALCTFASPPDIHFCKNYLSYHTCHPSRCLHILILDIHYLAPAHTCGSFLRGTPLEILNPESRRDGDLNASFESRKQRRSVDCSTCRITHGPYLYTPQGQTSKSWRSHRLGKLELTQEGDVLISSSPATNCWSVTLSIH